MSKKIVTNIFNYARHEGAHSLVVSNQKNQVSLDFYFQDGTCNSLALPQKLEQCFFSNLRQVLAIAPGELLTKKYTKIREKGCNLNLSLTVLPDGQGEKVVINISQPTGQAWRLNQLGLDRNDLKALRQALQARSGLIIIASPAAGGKSTTLHSCLEELASDNLNIYAFIDNIKAPITGVNSLAANSANWDKVLQHDSDVIAVDNLEDENNFWHAFRAATSGRLVIGTVTASSAEEALEKIHQVNLPLKLKLDSLKMIISQRLTALKRPAKGSKSDPRQVIGQFTVLSLSPEERKKLEKK